MRCLVSLLLAVFLIGCASSSVIPSVWDARVMEAANTHSAEVSSVRAHGEVEYAPSGPVVADQDGLTFAAGELPRIHIQSEQLAEFAVTEHDRRKGMRIGAGAGVLAGGIVVAIGGDGLANTFVPGCSRDTTWDDFGPCFGKTILYFAGVAALFGAAGILVGRAYAPRKTTIYRFGGGAIEGSVVGSSAGLRVVW